MYGQPAGFSSGPKIMDKLTVYDVGAQFIAPNHPKTAKPGVKPAAPLQVPQWSAAVQL
jgi:hypothetical protein